MGNWNQILNEINSAAGQPDQVRRQYLAKFFDLTGRNVVLYHQGTHPGDTPFSSFPNIPAEYLKRLEPPAGLEPATY